MRVFINAGHAPNGNPDPGACNSILGLRECDITAKCAELLESYLTPAGVEVVGSLQSDSLYNVCTASNNSGADIFVSIHCNAAGNESANGTETWFYGYSAEGEKLANCIQKQIIGSVSTTDRGVKGAVPHVNGLYVLTNTDAIAVLVELAFISNTDDAILLRDNLDDFARAIARGVTDYEAGC